MCQKSSSRRLAALVSCWISGCGVSTGEATYHTIRYIASDTEGPGTSFGATWLQSEAFEAPSECCRFAALKRTSRGSCTRFPLTLTPLI